MTDAEQSTRRAIDRDAKDLKRGVGINAIGYALKLAPFLLLMLVTNAYGMHRFGAFALAQAAILFAIRVGALGLDKGLLWWVPRQSADAKRRGIRSAVALAVALNAVIAAVIFVAGSPDVLRAMHQPAELSLPLRVLALAMVPQVATDVLMHASMGLRRMEAQVFVKDALVPILFPILAVAFYYAFDAVDLGMPIAFLVASTVGLFAAMRFHVRLFAGFPAAGRESVRPPAELVRYAIPMWMSEISNSLLQRLDIFLVEILTGDLGLVGAYNVARRFSDAIRTIRRSFDPIVVAIVAEIGVTGDRQRLTAGFSYATFLVTLTQLPVFAAVFAFASELAPLYGDGFEVAAVPIVILSVTWLFNGLFSLAGIVVTAYGASRSTLANTVFAIVVLAIGGLLLIPPLGLAGAATAVGIAYVAQALVQLVQMRIVTGGWNYDRSVLFPLVLGSVAGIAMAATWFALATFVPTLPPLATKVLAFAAFALVYTPGALRGRSRRTP